MHEASIIMGILETVLNQCQKEGYNKINSIHLRIGKAASVLPDCLQFAFDAAKRDTKAAQAKLVIEHIALGGLCQSCSQRFEVQQEFIFNCPACNSTKINIDQGYEMEIVEMDVD